MWRAFQFDLMRSIKGKTILVIDDDPAMLRALKRVLSGQGAVVSSATWVGEVMERICDQQGCLDLVITDLRLPVLGGESILAAVKASLPKVPVIVITAFGSPELQAQCLANGADEFLEKPLDTRQLVAAIDRVFLKRKPGSKRKVRQRKRLWMSEAAVAGNESLSQPMLADAPPAALVKTLT
jgi:DNA-binding NtrC family response regulator